MRKKINKAIALLAVLGILAGSGNVVYGNEENIADQEEQLTKEKESIYIDNTGCYERRLLMCIKTMIKMW